jgi:hypothetical protein
VVLLDVGSQMGDLLEPAAKTVSEFIQGKVRPGQGGATAAVVQQPRALQQRS